jgi:hypothetical protein
MLATGSVMTTATALRVSVSCLALLADRTPPLVRLAVTASARADSGRAQAAFRDEVLALTRDAAEATWRELRKGVDDLDTLTRPGENHAAQGAAQAQRRPHQRRPHRVKP